jgi:hypothetical protein
MAETPPTRQSQENTQAALEPSEAEESSTENEASETPTPTIEAGGPQPGSSVAENILERDRAAIEEVTGRLETHAAAHATPASAAHGAHASGGNHHHKEGAISGPFKNVFALFGLFVMWIYQAIKRAPEMAGKGGGGAKKSGGDHGGGH